MTHQEQLDEIQIMEELAVSMFTKCTELRISIQKSMNKMSSITTSKVNIDFDKESFEGKREAKVIQLKAV